MSATAVVDTPESVLSITSEDRDIAAPYVQNGVEEMTETLEKTLNGALEGTNNTVASDGATLQDDESETQQHAEAENEILSGLNSHDQVGALSKGSEKSLEVAPTSVPDVEGDGKALSLESTFPGPAKVEESAHVNDAFKEAVNDEATSSEGLEESVAPVHPEPSVKPIDISREVSTVDMPSEDLPVVSQATISQQHLEEATPSDSTVLTQENIEESVSVAAMLDTNGKHGDGTSSDLQSEPTVPVIEETAAGAEVQETGNLESATPATDAELSAEAPIDAVASVDLPADSAAPVEESSHLEVVGNSAELLVSEPPAVAALLNNTEIDASVMNKVDAAESEVGSGSLKLDASEPEVAEVVESVQETSQEHATDAATAADDEDHRLVDEQLKDNDGVAENIEGATSIVAECSSVATVVEVLPPSNSVETTSSTAEEALTDAPSQIPDEVPLTEDAHDSSLIDPVTTNEPTDSDVQEDLPPTSAEEAPAPELETTEAVQPKDGEEPVSELTTAEDTSATVVAEEAPAPDLETTEVTAQPKDEEEPVSELTTAEDTSATVVAELEDEEKPVSELTHSEETAAVVAEPKDADMRSTIVKETSAAVVEPQDANVQSTSVEETPAAVVEPQDADVQSTSAEETSIVVVEPQDADVQSTSAEETSAAVVELQDADVQSTSVAETSAAAVVESEDGDMRVISVEETPATVLESKDADVSVSERDAPVSESVSIEETSESAVVEPKDEDLPVSESNASVETSAIVVELRDEEMSVSDPTAPQETSAAEVELGEKNLSVDDSSADISTADELSTNAEASADIPSTLANDQPSADAPTTVEDVATAAAEEEAESAEPDHVGSATKEEVVDHQTSAIIEAGDATLESTSNIALKDRESSELTTAASSGDSSVLSMVEDSSLESASTVPASAEAAAENLEDAGSLNDGNAFVNGSVVEQEVVSGEAARIDEVLSQSVTEAISVGTVGIADASKAAPMEVAEVETSEPIADHDASVSMPVIEPPEVVAKPLKEEETNELDSKPGPDEAETEVAPPVQTESFESVIDASAEMPPTTRENLESNTQLENSVMNEAIVSLSEILGDDGLVDTAAGLAANAVDIDRPKSPWTPSYSVTNQGPGIPSEQEIPEMDELPPSETSIMAHSEESQIPVINVAASAEGVVVVSDPAEHNTNAETVSSRPSSPWVPSYSVSVQGSPSPSVSGSPVAAPVDLPADEAVEDIKEPAAQAEIVAESIQRDTQPIPAIDIVEPVPVPVEDEPTTEESVSKEELTSVGIPEEEHSEKVQQKDVVEHSDHIMDETKIVEVSGPEQTEESHEQHEINVEQPSEEAPVAAASDVPTTEDENVVTPAIPTAEILIIESAGIERPKSPWGSYEVTTQQGSGTSDEQTIPISETAEDVYAAPKSFIQEATIEDIVSSGEKETEQIDPATGTVEEVKVISDSSRLTVDDTTNNVSERPKSPWTPSYSVTRQGSGVFEDPKDDAELDTLEQLPPRAASPAPAAAPIEVKAEDTSATETPAATGLVSKLKTEEAEAAEADGNVPPSANAAQVFPGGHDHEGSQQSLTSLDTVDNSVAKNRKRLESTASSLFFPGGWFSKAPAGRASLDNAQGEFVQSNPSSPVGAPTSQAAENTANADTSPTDDKEKKSKWCIIM